MQQKIVLIGAGNMGYHLGKQLYERQAGLIQIYSRTREKAKTLSEVTGNTPYITELENIRTDADLYILAIKDDAIEFVVEQLKRLGEAGKFVVHTSGVTPSAVFKPWYNRFGSFYPFQSFSRDRQLDFSEVPVCFYANTQKDAELLDQLGQQLGCNTYPVNDKERAILHVNGVFVNNFTNYLYRISWEIMEKEGLPFELLRPLILETAQKIMEHSPEAMQTGPAIRNDQRSIKRHIKYLKNWPAYRKIYKVLTKGISKKS
jgi:predicted short-subunit dehydrogenase-like oxidoreductase (DUF2520 family)